jgi:protease IV
MSSPSDRGSADSGSARPAPRRSRGSTFVLLMVTGFGLAVFVASVAAVVFFVSERSPQVSEDSFLEVVLAEPLTDAPVQGGLFFDPADAPPTLSDVVGAIRDAAEDPRISGAFLQFDGGSPGFAGAEEIRSALGELRAAGKPCVAYAEVYDTLSYYIASKCDRVVMPPSGVALVTGLAVSTTYYAGTFEKIGVKADMLHVGDFKSAVEPYERTEPSEPAALAMNEMLDGLWASYVAGIAEGRGKSPEVVQGWIDRPALSAKGMLASGMVDALAYPDQLRRHLEDIDAEGWAAGLAVEVALDDDELEDKFTSVKDYRKSGAAVRAWSSGQKKVAVLFAEGNIVSGEAGGGMFGGASAIADRTTREWLREVAEDDDVAAVVLRVNSPGGSGLASDMIWREVQRLKADGKPIVVSMGNYAASGGYYIATAGDWIVAEPSTLTGSIGVFGGKVTFGGTYDWAGLTQATYKRGQNSDLLSLTSTFSEEGRAVYQTFLDDFYETFLARVSEARGLTRDEAHAIAQGRVWTGQQALERKLVDEIGGLDRAVAKAAELAELGTEYAVERWPKSKTFFELMLEDFDQASASALGLAGRPAALELPFVDEEALQELVLLENILGDGGAAALMPGSLRIVHKSSTE